MGSLLGSLLRAIAAEPVPEKTSITDQSSSKFLIFSLLLFARSLNMIRIPFFSSCINHLFSNASFVAATIHSTEVEQQPR